MSAKRTKKNNLSDVNYKKKTYYDTAMYPIRQPRFFTWLILFLSKLVLWFSGIKYKVERINMDDIKAPYMLLSNHMAFVDFELVAVGTYPQKMNYVIAIDGFYRRPWLLEWIGGIATRKYTQDLHLIKSIKKVLDRGDVLTMYPEAEYSPCGVPCPIPDALATLIKKFKVPVVVANQHGNHLRAPAWNFRQKKKVPLYTTIKQVLTKDDVKEKTVEDIDKIIRDALDYDDYRYQKENNILIKEKFRAEGLHKVLYKCPNCKTEFKMNSKGAEIYCEECGKYWIWEENGNLKSEVGETEFSHIPDWFNWQKEEVRKEILSGKYSFSDEVNVYTLPHCWKYRSIGKGVLTHNFEDGFTLTGSYRGKDYTINRTPLENISLHCEYDLRRVKKPDKKGDCIDLSVTKDSFYCFPKNNRAVTKLRLATEEMYKLKRIEIKKNKK